MKKIVKILDALVDKAWLTLCAGLLVLGSYSFVDILNVYANAQDKSLLKYKPDVETGETDALKDIKDYRAWITLDDTTVDYPVVQGTNNHEYINKDPYGKFSLSGSIFEDSRNKADFTDQYTILYGHHMDKTLTAKSVMFGALDDFYEKDFFKNHRTGTLTVDKTKYQLEVFAIAEADASSDVFNTDKSFDEINNWLKQNAVFYDDPKGNSILALSTCKSYKNGDRTLLFCTYNVNKDDGKLPVIDNDGNSIQELNKSKIHTGVKQLPVGYIAFGGLAIAGVVVLMVVKKSGKVK